MWDLQSDSYTLEDLVVGLKRRDDVVVDGPLQGRAMELNNSAHVC
jgi:hypothetical protein